MNQRDQESICALSTPAGTGALALVRISGGHALRIGRRIAPFLPEKPESHHAYFGRLLSAKDSDEFDEAVVTYFGPRRSFTGEETLEFSIHGSPSVVQELLKSLVAWGAKPATKGEFTYRAFMNGKLDLVQAESVLALIQSQSSLSTKQALRQLKGGLSQTLTGFESEIIWSLAHIEAGIDFSQEGLETVSAPELLARLGQVKVGLDRLLASYHQGRLVQEGLQVVLIGRPNVGKSSLLNAVIDEEKAIVTEIAGTTRDLIQAVLSVAGVQVNLIDTAGLREAQDLVEKIGIERTQKASREADLIFFIFDLTQGLQSEEIQELSRREASRLILVGNKLDRVKQSRAAEKIATLEKLQAAGLSAPWKMLFVSALDKSGAQAELTASLADWLAAHQIEDQSLLFQARHFERLSQATHNLEQGLALVRAGLSPELAALELKEALLCVQETLGKFFDDQILDRVFKEFCIGK